LVLIFSTKICLKNFSFQEEFGEILYYIIYHVSYLILSYRIVSCLILPHLIVSYRILPYILVWYHTSISYRIIYHISYHITYHIMYHIYISYHIYHIIIIVNCNCVTRWQQYSTHLHTNSTQNNTINLGRVRTVPRLGELYPGSCLTAEEKARRNLRQGRPQSK